MRIFDNGIYRDMTAEEIAEINIAEPIPYKERVAARIREKYSLDDEIALIRQKDTKPEEFQAYFEYAERVKQEEK